MDYLESSDHGGRPPDKQPGDTPHEDAEGISTTLRTVRKLHIESRCAVEIHGSAKEHLAGVEPDTCRPRRKRKPRPGGRSYSL